MRDVATYESIKEPPEAEVYDNESWYLIISTHCPMWDLSLKLFEYDGLGYQLSAFGIEKEWLCSKHTNNSFLVWRKIEFFSKSCNFKFSIKAAKRHGEGKTNHEEWLGVSKMKNL